MPIIKPFTPEKGYTKINNDLLDYVMPKLSPNAWKILCFIIRKTKGWHKEEDHLSISQIINETGIKNRTTVSKALKDLEKEHLINIYRPDDKVTSNSYSLNIDVEIEVGGTENRLPGPEIVPDQNGIEGGSGTENVSGVVQKSYPQKKGLNKSTPNGVSDKSLSEEKSKKPNEPGPRKKLMGAFLNAANMSIPRNKKTEGFWWSQITDIEGVVNDTLNGDVSCGQQLIADVVKAMRRDKLSIGGPQSIVNLFRDKASARASPNGNHANDLSEQQLKQIQEFNQ